MSPGAHRFQKTYTLDGTDLQITTLITYQQQKAAVKTQMAMVAK